MTPNEPQYNPLSLLLFVWGATNKKDRTNEFHDTLRLQEFAHVSWVAPGCHGALFEGERLKLQGKDLSLRAQFLRLGVEGFGENAEA